ncbi:MAG: ribonuclease PH [Opitutales bacterium]
MPDLTSNAPAGTATSAGGFARPDGRAPDALRPITFEPGFAPHATGSVLASFGQTRVICAAMADTHVPRWMQEQANPRGWVTAEYSMLPYSTLERKQRDSSRGKLDGRSVEIQRLIGRSLRAVFDLHKMPGISLWLDCDVLQADGGTRTAAISGAWVAARLAVNKLLADGKLEQDPIREAVAAISVGVCEDTPLLDLAYLEDRDASVDANIVMTASGRFVEIQGSGEEATFSAEELQQLLGLAGEGIRQILDLQQQTLTSL